MIGNMHENVNDLMETVDFWIQNDAEVELDRLGFAYNERVRRVKNSRLNFLMDQASGPLVERHIVPLVQSAKYLNSTDVGKKNLLKIYMDIVREGAKALAVKQEPRLFEQLKLNAMHPTKKAFMEERIGRSLDDIIYKKGQGND